ncbi:MAG: DUF6899 family protein [Acidobacteriota bacterium]
MKKVCVALLIPAVAMIAFSQAGSEWKPLFNGRDLSGWEHVGPGKFTVQDGLLKPEGGMGLLWYTGEKIGNAVVRVAYKMENPIANSETSSARERLAKGGSPETAGELNYAITKLVDDYVIRKGGIRYMHINEVIGALECAKLELYRRVAVPYEDQKIRSAGDVYRSRRK